MPIFWSMSESDIGKTFPFAQTIDRRLPGGLDRVEHGREELRLRRRPELVVDDHGDLRRRGDSSEKRGPETGDSSAARAASVAFATGAGSSG